jgi:hypothetical protein
MMNLPRGAAEILKPHRLMWVQIGVEIDNQGELLRRLL